MSIDPAILLCYDGSEDAQAATDRAARLFPGASVTVLAVWEPISDPSGSLASSDLFARVVT
jgi:hypothetical protein